MGLSLISNKFPDICDEVRMADKLPPNTIEDLFAKHSYKDMLQLAQEEESLKLPTIKRIGNYIEALYSSIKHSIHYLNEVEEDITRLEREKLQIPRPLLPGETGMVFEDRDPKPLPSLLFFSWRIIIL